MFRHNIRITINEDTVLKGKVVKFFAALSETVILCQEDADEEVKHNHIHIALESKYSQDQLRKKMLKTFVNSEKPFKGNDCYSMGSVKETEEDWLNLKQYICKGIFDCHPNVLYKQNFTQEDIETYHSNFWKWKLNQIKERKPLITQVETIVQGILTRPKPKRARAKTFTELFIEDIELNFPDREFRYCRTDIEFISKKWCKALGQRGKMLDMNILNKQIGGILNHFTEEYGGYTLKETGIWRSAPDY